VFQEAGFLNFHRATPGELLLVGLFTKIQIFSKGKTKIFSFTPEQHESSYPQIFPIFDRKQIY
jgi:hypothetical protein